MAASLMKCACYLTTECSRFVRDFRALASLLQYPGPGLDLAVISPASQDAIRAAQEGKHHLSGSRLDSIFGSLLLAVQRNRRSAERRLTRRMQLPGHFEYAIPRRDIVACLECGHFHEKGTLCANCYSKVREETEKMMEELGEDMKYTANQKEVVFLYQGQEAKRTEYQGKHIVQMKKEQPPWFPKNLMAKKDT